MKIAVSFPTTVQLVEKIGALFGEIHLIGFNGKYAQENRYTKKFPDLGIKVHLHPEHYSHYNPYDYDLLIDSWETRLYNPEWKEWSLKWKIPRILKVLWFAKPKRKMFTDNEFKTLNKSVISPENFVLTNRWKDIGFTNVKTLLYFPGKWWFEEKWTGEIPKALYILSVNKNRDCISTGLPDWKKIETLLPDHTYHQNGYKHFLPSRELAKMCKKYRCFVNLDQTNNARPLCLVFTEALCAGIPPIIIKQPNTDYSRYIQNGTSGFICQNLDEVISKIKLLIKDYNLAKMMSAETAKIGESNFSEQILRPKWEEAIKIAQSII